MLKSIIILSHKIILFFTLHVSIFLIMSFLLILIINIFSGNDNSVEHNVIIKSYKELFDSTGGNLFLLFGGTVYIIGFSIYETITDSYKYFTTRKFIYLIRILLCSLLIIGSISYLLWITKLI